MATLSLTAAAPQLADIAFLETSNGARLPYADFVRQGRGNVRVCLQLLETALVPANAHMVTATTQRAGQKPQGTRDVPPLRSTETVILAFSRRFCGSGCTR